MGSDYMGYFYPCLRRAVVRYALQCNPSNNGKGWSHPLKYASEELKNNKKVVLSAVAQNATALAHASQKLQENKDATESYLRKVERLEEEYKQLESNTTERPKYESKLSVYDTFLSNL